MNTRCSNKHANTVPTSRGQGVSVHTLASAQAGATAAETTKFRKENLFSLTSLDEVQGTGRREDRVDVNRQEWEGPMAQWLKLHMKNSRGHPRPRLHRQRAPESGHIPGLGEGLGSYFLIY